MLKQIITISYVVFLGLTANSLPINAQPVPRKISFINLGRAENLARQAAEEINGGLQHYRAENSMYGPAERSPHTYDKFEDGY